MTTVEYKVLHASHSGTPIHRVAELMDVRLSTYYEADEETVELLLETPLIPLTRIIVCILVPLRIRFEISHGNILWSKTVTEACDLEMKKVVVEPGGTCGDRVKLTISRVRSMDTIKLVYIMMKSNEAQQKKEEIQTTVFPEGHDFYGNGGTLKRQLRDREKPKGTKKVKDERGKAKNSNTEELKNTSEPKRLMSGNLPPKGTICLADQPIVQMFNEALTGYVLTTTATGENRLLIQELIEALGAVFLDSIEEGVKILIADDKIPPDEAVREARSKGIAIVSWHWLFQCQETNRAVDYLVYSLE